MFYDRILFLADNVSAWREIDAQGHVTRYCDDAGNDLDRNDPIEIVCSDRPAWALPDPDPVVEPSPPPPAPRTCSKLDFIDRLGHDYLTILTVAKQNVQIEAFVRRFDMLQGDINLDDPRLVAGMQALEAAGLIAAGRAGEILA